MTHPTSLASQMAYDSAPLGTRVSRPGGEYLMKEVDGWHTFTSGGGHLDGPHTVLSSHRRVLRWGLGDTEAPAEAPTRISEHMYASAPVGTKVRRSGGGYIEKIGVNQWQTFRPDGTARDGTTSDSLWSAPREVIRWGLAELDTFTVGQVLDSAGQLDRLPVGARVSRLTAAGHWQRLTGGWHEINGLGLDLSAGGRTSADVWRMGHPRTILALPDAEPAPTEPEFHVGQRLTLEEMQRLPVGARVSRSGLDGWWEVGEDDNWQECREDGTPSGVTRWPAQRVWDHDNRRVLLALPDLPDAAGGDEVFTVGQLITSLEQLDALPDGTELAYNRNGDFGQAQSVGERRRKANGEWPGNWIGLRDNIGEGRRRWFIVDLPAEVADPDEGPQVGDTIHDREQVRTLPVGSMLRGGDGDHYVKTEEPDTWYHSNSAGRRAAVYSANASGCFSMTGYNTITRVGPGDARANPETVRERVERAKADVRAAIDSCVASNGHNYARDGAFWLFGIADLPGPATGIPFGSAFGLPVGSLVSHHGTVWVVNSHDVRYPQHHLGPQRHMGREDLVTVVALAEAEPEPEWLGYNHFLHTVWERERVMREWHSWCTAAEECLIEQGLDDPGDLPDEEDEAATLVVGEVMHGALTQAQRRAIDALPNGSVIHPAGLRPVFKTSAGWIDTSGGSDNRALTRYGITVRYIHVV